MRIRVTHATTYSYEGPARSITQILRLTPRSHDGQQVAAWRLEADADVRLRPGEDAFGNTTHILSLDGPVEGLTLTVHGEVVTFDTGGVIRGASERLPPEIYLRTTPLTEAEASLRDFVADVDGAARSDPLEALHALLAAVTREVAFDTQATEAVTTASQAFALRRGVCQDLAHIFIAGARLLGHPARYVSGHLVRYDTVEQEASHAWAEAFVPGLGWVGFDPANGICATEFYVRIAAGLDYLGAAPVRGTRQGGGRERLAVRLAVQQMQASQQ